jgi:hypothetical protein
MFSRYLRYDHCMQSALGRLWWETYHVAQGMNSWGVSESTQSGIDQAPAAVRKADETCRIENAIQNEPRPRLQLPFQLKEQGPYRSH